MLVFPVDEAFVLKAYRAEVDAQTYFRIAGLRIVQGLRKGFVIGIGNGLISVTMTCSTKKSTRLDAIFCGFIKDRHCVRCNCIQGMYWKLRHKCAPIYMLRKAAA